MWIGIVRCRDGVVSTEKGLFEFGSFGDPVVVDFGYDVFECWGWC